MASQRRQPSLFAKLAHTLAVLFGGITLAGAFFLVLPLMQTIARGPSHDMDLTAVNAVLDKPPPPLEEKEEEPPKADDEPKLEDIAQDRNLLDLSELTLSLNPGDGGTGQIQVASLLAITGDAARAPGEQEALFSEDQLDQRPRAIRQPGPMITSKVRERARQVGQGAVLLIFVVNKDGLVENVIVQRSLDPVLDEAAVVAVRQWRFEPGRRKGQPVRFRMRVPIQYPKGL